MYDIIKIVLSLWHKWITKIAKNLASKRLVLENYSTVYTEGRSQILIFVCIPRTNVLYYMFLTSVHNR
jgi:hypothetical protein